MKKGATLIALLLSIGIQAFAQAEKKDSVSVKPDTTATNPVVVVDDADDFDFSLTEGQLDEDAEAASTVTLVQSAKDPYLNEVGFKWSAMRFKYRALDNAYVGNYINGVKFNNVENGRFSFSGISGGLNDAMRNRTGVTNLNQCHFGFAPLGGATNIDIRASHYAAGHKVGLAYTNRNYRLRAQYTYASGLLKNGWAFMGSVAYRYANEGNIEGTFYNSFSFMLGAEKKINDQHSIALNIWGAPTERGQQGASTEEAYALANSHYYNPYWGYQNGKKRNSRVVTEFSPSALLTWDWKINDDTKMTTAAAFTWMNYASTALSYNNSYNPAPDYYKNMPSSVFNVYSDTYNEPGWLGENPGVYDAYQGLYNRWTGAKANRQVQWDLLYAQNEANNATGKDALYYQEKRHNNQLAFNFTSYVDGKMNDHGTYTAGVNLNTTKGMHYKTMADLLGADTFHDYDNYSLNKYGSKSPEYQNDLDNPDRVIKVGDKFGYNYNIYVTKIKAYATNSWKWGGFSLNYGGDIEGTLMEREGLMRNGRAADYSKGKSGMAKFLGGGGKITLAQNIASSTIYLGASIESQAPLAYNSFVAPRIQNNFVDNLKNEWYWNAEVGYQWHFGPVIGKVSAYYTRYNDVTQQTVFYNDDAAYLTYLTMTGIQKEYKGVEAAISVQLVRNLKLHFLGTISDARYLNNPNAQLAYEGSDGKTLADINNEWKNEVTGGNRQLVSFMKNVRVDSTPLAAASLGLSYNIKGWYFDVTLNYFDRVYIAASSYGHLANDESKDGNVAYGISSIVKGIDANTGEEYNANTLAKKQAANGYIAYVYDEKTGEVTDTYTPEQEKAKGGFMLDASIGKSITFRNGKRLSINLQVQNITNNTNMKTGGYEYNRAERPYDYQFSKNSKYFYANPINAFLNVSFKF